MSVMSPKIKLLIESIERRMDKLVANGDSCCVVIPGEFVRTTVIVSLPDLEIHWRGPNSSVISLEDRETEIHWPDGDLTILSMSRGNVLRRPQGAIDTVDEDGLVHALDVLQRHMVLDDLAGIEPTKGQLLFFPQV